MKHLIESLALCAALLVGNIVAHADETAGAAATPAATPAPAADTAPAADIADAAPAAKDDDKPMVHIEIDANDGEKQGTVEHVVSKGVAHFLETHVLTRDDLSDEDRKEVEEAIAELRGEVTKEATAAGHEIRDEVRREVHEAIKDSVKDHTRSLVRGAHDSPDDDGFGAFQAIVAITAIIFTLGMPILIVSLILFFGYRRRRLAHDTINKFLSSGKEIPPEVMQNLFKDAGTATTTPRNNLYKGTINTSLGLGMVIGFNAIDVEFLAAIGFIFLLVGLAQLLIWKLEQGKKSEGDSTQG